MTVQPCCAADGTSHMRPGLSSSLLIFCAWVIDSAPQRTCCDSEDMLEHAVGSRLPFKGGDSMPYGPGMHVDRPHGCELTDV